MSEIEQQLDGVELSIQQAKNLIERSDALRRLEKNKDFQFLFLDGLLKDDAIRQVMLLASPGLKVPGEGAVVAKAGIQARVDMIGELYNWCRWTHMEADQARKALAEHEEARAELLQEQLVEG
jgi:hypothetical protein